MALKDKVEQALLDIKWAFFEELKELMKDYDIERVQFDESYEISPEAEAKWDELVDYSEEWDFEFWDWMETLKQNGEI